MKTIVSPAALLLPILAAAVGCTSMQTIKPNPETTLADTIRQEALPAVGDEVQIMGRDGLRLQGKVARVDRERIVLESGQAIRIDNVAALRVRKVSAGRTAAAGVGGWIAIVLITASVTFMEAIGVL